MLAEALHRDQRIPGTDVLDLCSGSGALAVAARKAGAATATAVDVSRRAVMAARLNGALNGVRVQALRGDLFEPVAGRRFDAVVSNPPYLPADGDELPQAGPERAWDAGVDGRALIDRIATGVADHLRPDGVLLLVQSSLCGVAATLERLEAGGLDAEVVERRRGSLGPLLAARAGDLERRGLLPLGEREEDLVVVRARYPGRSAASSASLTSASARVFDSRRTDRTRALSN
jgi:release factor glutamine methyltransferase